MGIAHFLKKKTMPSANNPKIIIKLSTTHICKKILHYVAYFLKFSNFKNSFAKNAESCGFQR